MASTQDIAGQITITLNYQGDQQHAEITSAIVHSSRPVQASKLFNGQSTQNTLELVKRLFSVCNHAQRCAAVRALESATGHIPEFEVECLRQSLVDMETIREHLWRIFLDWPGHLGEEPERVTLAKVIKIQHNFEEALGGADYLFSPKAEKTTIDLEKTETILNSLQRLIETHIISAALDNDLRLKDWDKLPADTIALKMFKHIYHQGWGSACQTSSKTLPDFTDKDIPALQAQMENWAFIQQPTWNNLTCETTSLSRATCPRVESAKRHFNNGLLTRAISLVTEVLGLVEKLRQTFTPVGLTNTQDTSLRLFTGHSIGKVNAARGQLVHSLKLSGDTIKSYRILAPTEWNFHPLGMIQQGLRSLSGSLSDIEKQAKLFIDLTDPCISYQLELCPQEVTCA